MGAKGVAMTTKFGQNCTDFSCVQDIEKFYRVDSRFSVSANSNVPSEFSREQRELPWQPNLGKSKAKLHRFQLCTRYRDIFRVNSSVSPVTHYTTYDCCTADLTTLFPVEYIATPE